MTQTHRGRVYDDDTPEEMSGEAERERGKGMGSSLKDKKHLSGDRMSPMMEKFKKKFDNNFDKFI